MSGHPPEQYMIGHGLLPWLLFPYHYSLLRRRQKSKSLTSLGISHRTAECFDSRICGSDQGLQWHLSGQALRTSRGDPSGIKKGRSPSQCCGNARIPTRRLCASFAGCVNLRIFWWLLFFGFQTENPGVAPPTVGRGTSSSTLSAWEMGNWKRLTPRPRTKRLQVL